MTSLKTIIILCRLSYIEKRRSIHFKRDIIIWTLQFALWILFAWSMRRYGPQSLQQHIPELIISDFIIRLLFQTTPNYKFTHYHHLPIPRHSLRIAYALRYALMPINYIWLPALWPMWWLAPVFMANGYVYLAFRHIVVTLAHEWAKGISLPDITGNGLISREMRLRWRTPAIRKKMTGSILCAFILTILAGITSDIQEFAILYAMLAPSLPVLASRHAWDEDCMGLLRSRMHTTRPIDRARYYVSVIYASIAAILLCIPASTGHISTPTVMAWYVITTIVIMPILTYCAPKTKKDSPTSQIVTLASLTLPILIFHQIVKEIVQILVQAIQEVA